MGKVALVFGANGISGTALIAQLTETPSNEWSKIIAVSRRPPQLELDDPRVVFASVDILKATPENFAKILIDHGAKDAEHAFYYTYIEKATEDELVSVNMELLTKTMAAVAKSAPNLKTFMLQTGYKYYGAVKGPPARAKTPWVEDAPRTDSDKNFYYAQEDFVKQFCEEHNWKWIVSRPNVILGVSKGNFMNLAVSIGIYAALQKYQGKKLAFPGCKEHWNARDDYSTATNNADFQIWVSLNEKAGNAAYNTADGEKILTKDLWHKIAEYFAIDVPPENEIVSCPHDQTCAHSFVLKDYMEKNTDCWHKIAEKHGLDPSAFDYATWAFVDAILQRSWADDGSLEKLRKIGWKKSVDSIQSFYDTFDKMKELHIIPK